jgi:3-hydroxyacyl-CoA dehydrogenase
MLSSHAGSFYRSADAGDQPRTEYFDFTGVEYKVLEEQPGTVRLADVKRARGVISENGGASLIDLGDGVLCVEFHSKMNAIGEDAIRMTRLGLEETEQNFDAMIIANQENHFCAGANLTMFLLAAQEGDFDQIDVYLRAFQEMNVAIRCCGKPVIAAPFGYTLGGGCEIVLHAARVQASAELYMGLVECDVGLIPAGGGCKQMLVNIGDAQRAFELSRAGASSSAAHARELGLLSSADPVTMNPDRLVADAKQLALSVARSYVPSGALDEIPVGGEAAYAKLKMGVWQAHEAGHVTDYGMVIAEKIARVLSGGRLTGTQVVTEQYLLDLEREAFLSLCGNKETQDRIAHMLKTGKALRN